LRRDMGRLQGQGLRRLYPGGLLMATRKANDPLA
jgi:hypothetical protein